MNSWQLHEQPVLRTLRETSGPERAEGFDYGLFWPPLRASLESLDLARDPELVEGLGAKHPVETCNEDFSSFAGANSRIL
jgi:hypothetical protein